MVALDKACLAPSLATTMDVANVGLEPYHATLMLPLLIPSAPLNVKNDLLSNMNL